MPRPRSCLGDVDHDSDEAPFAIVVAARAAFDDLSCDAVLARMVLDVELPGSRRLLRFLAEPTALSAMVLVGRSGLVLCLAVEPACSTVVEVHRPSARVAQTTTDGHGRCLVRLATAGLLRFELHHDAVRIRTSWLHL